MCCESRRETFAILLVYITLMHKRSPKVILIIMLLASAPALSADLIPRDYAVVLRDTPIYENLELYAKVLGNASAKDVYPLISLKEDEYGILWAEVSLDDSGEKTGFLTDVVSIRLTRDVLESVLSNISPEQFSLWDQEILDGIVGQSVDTGDGYITMLLAQGSPVATRELGDAVEYAYPERRYLVRAGEVVACLTQQRVAANKRINLELATSDPGFELAGGRWSGEEIRINSIESGQAFYSFIVPASGAYSFTLKYAWNENYSSNVNVTLIEAGTETCRFYLNQKLARQSALLGQTTLRAGEQYQLAVKAADGLPFSTGTVSIDFINMPGSN